MTDAQKVADASRFRIAYIATALMNTLSSVGCFAVTYHTLSSVTAGIIVIVTLNSLLLLMLCVEYARPPRGEGIAAGFTTTCTSLIGSLIAGFSLIGGWPWMAVAMGFVFITTMFILVRDLDTHMNLALLILFGFGQALAIAAGVRIVVLLLLPA